MLQSVAIDYSHCWAIVFIMSYSDSIHKAKEKIDSVNQFINLIEKNSDTFKSVGISVSFKGQTVI